MHDVLLLKRVFERKLTRKNKNTLLHTRTPYVTIRHENTLRHLNILRHESILRHENTLLQEKTFLKLHFGKLIGFVFPQMAGIRVKLNQLRDELETCVSEQNYEKAAEIKSKIVEAEEERSDLEKEELTENNSQTRIEKVKRLVSVLIFLNAIFCGWIA